MLSGFELYPRWVPLPLIQRMIVTSYVNIFLTFNMELENRFILISVFAGSTSPQQAIFFPLGGGGVRKGGSII